MLIEFGWSLDGAAWADGAGATGSVRLGPRGLVQLLLHTPPPPPPL